MNIDNKKIWTVTRSKTNAKFFGDVEVLAKKLTRQEAREFAAKVQLKENKRQFNKTYPNNQIRSITICNEPL